MKLVVGLGNPGRKYTNTRHNVGFMALDHYSHKARFKPEAKFGAELREDNTGTEKVIFAKPQTYMNRSGQPVRSIVDYYQLDTENILIIYDELALPFGTVRSRSGGEAAGHNGIKSIIKHLDNPDFKRLRIGIANEHADKQPAEKFVLQTFSRQEKKLLPEIFQLTTPLIDRFVNGDDLPAETHRLENQAD